MLVAGELTRDCVTDMRDLYGLPPKEDCDSATLLLDLYEEVSGPSGVCQEESVCASELRVVRTGHLRLPISTMVMSLGVLISIG